LYSRSSTRVGKRSRCLSSFKATLNALETNAVSFVVLSLLSDPRGLKTNLTCRDRFYFNMPLLPRLRLDSFHRIKGRGCGGRKLTTFPKRRRVIAIASLACQARPSIRYRPTPGTDGYEASTAELSYAIGRNERRSIETSICRTSEPLGDRTREHRGKKSSMEAT
jgi:hypothetical protein